MSKCYKFVAIIPARQGSKGLKNKNIISLAGNPLISYSIAASLSSTLIEKTIVSTDSEEIKKIAQKYGAETPFLRPESISNDLSKDVDFLQHALQFLEENEKCTIENIVLLRPTSPLRPAGFIDKGIKHFLKFPEAESLRTISPVAKSPYKMWKQKGDYIENILDPDHINERYNDPRQLLPEIWLQAGALDIISTKIIKRGSVSGKKILHLKVDQNDFCDIDNSLDLIRAEEMLSSGRYITLRK